MLCCSGPPVEYDDEGYALACEKDLIPEKSGVRVKIGRKNIAIFQKKKKIFAVADACSHEGISLYSSDIEDFKGTSCITCPGHGYRFDIKTGKCIDNPQFVQRKYRVKLVGDQVWVLMKENMAK